MRRLLNLLPLAGCFPGLFAGEKVTPPDQLPEGFEVIEEEIERRATELPIEEMRLALPCER